MQTKTISNIFTRAVLCVVLSGAGNAGPPSRPGDEQASLIEAVTAHDREVWWPAAQKLGALASGDHARRDEIWRRAHVNTVGMKFARVEPGEFTMGPDTHRLFAGRVAHKVRITKPYYIGATEVTNQQFKMIVATHEPDLKYSPEADSPAVGISWAEANHFCRVLSEREGVTYRLPTEAEWEYACRAGSTTMYSFGNSPEKMSEYGWCLRESSKAALVAMLKPNNWGLYDMHGNVFEWVADYHSDTYYGSCAEEGIVDNPQGPKSGRTHVLRSCGWQVDNPLACTCTARFPMPIFNKKPFSDDIAGMRDTTGFRVVREVSESEAR